MGRPCSDACPCLWRVCARKPLSAQRSGAWVSTDPCTVWLHRLCVFLHCVHDSALNLDAQSPVCARAVVR